MDLNFSGGCLCRSVRFTVINPAPTQAYSSDICQSDSGCHMAVWLEFHFTDVELNDKRSYLLNIAHIKLYTE